MRNLVLGIIALICLDIGFVYYTSVGLQRDLTVNKAPTPEQTATAAAPSDISNNLTAASGPSADNTAGPTDIAGVKADSEEVLNDRGVRPSMQRRASGVKARQRSNEYRSAARTKVIFATVIFYVPRHSTTATERVVYVKNTRELNPAAEKQFVRTAPKSENRSLVARVWPVIKKPYDWIKVLGSKFN